MIFCTTLKYYGNQSMTV